MPDHSGPPYAARCRFKRESPLRLGDWNFGSGNLTSSRSYLSSGGLKFRPLYPRHGARPGGRSLMCSSIERSAGDSGVLVKVRKSGMQCHKFLCSSWFFEAELTSFLFPGRAVGLLNGVVAACRGNDLEVLHSMEHRKRSKSCPIAPQLARCESRLGRHDVPIVFRKRSWPQTCPGEIASGDPAPRRYHRRLATTSVSYHRSRRTPRPGTTENPVRVLGDVAPR